MDTNGWTWMCVDALPAWTFDSAVVNCGDDNEIYAGNAKWSWVVKLPVSAVDFCSPSVSAIVLVTPSIALTPSDQSRVLLAVLSVT